jgi:uncharacterized membrane protein YoaK (UPF0700 family)/anti-anti-sigma regulatory factor
VFIAQAHSFTQQARLAITLAWVAGYTNIVALISCGTVTSHVTGSASNFGRHVVEGNWPAAAFVLLVLLMFFVGACVSAILTEFGWRRGSESIYVLPALVQAILLTAFAVGLELREPNQPASLLAVWWLTGLASMAMGLQNATITRISSGVVRTTHLTGVLTDLGSETVQFLFWLSDRHRSSPPLSPTALFHSARTHPTATRLALLASIIGSFMLGAALGTLAVDHFARWAMVPPVLFLLWIIWQDIQTPICEIEVSGEFAAQGVQLPAGLAVYHLRRDKKRVGDTHRLPNLLRWCSRLPPGVRVLVLDLSELTRFDSDAAWELRALVKQATGRGRQVLFAGMSGVQYNAMRAGGAGDVLDPNNVCPDIELAVARAIMLLEHPSARAG